MAEQAQTTAFENVSSEAAFQAALQALAPFGFSVWKTRPIGGLIIANGAVEGNTAQATVTVRVGTSTEVGVSVRSDSAGEEQLEAFLNQYFDALRAELGKSN